MELLLQRLHSNSETGTFGALYVDRKFQCYTLEDVVREVPGQAVLQWKVPGKTAIPSTAWTGHDYRITFETSGRFGPETITVNAVPGFTYIRMHAGNVDEDTEGCILVGTSICPMGITGGTSAPALSALKSRIRVAIAMRDNITLEIRNPEEITR